MADVTLWACAGSRSNPAEPSAELVEIMSLLNYLGGNLMGIDAKLETIVMLLEDEDDDGD